MKQTAIKAAKEAGKILLEFYNKEKKVEIKKGQTFNQVSEVDKKAEEKIIGIVKEKCPSHAFLAEESGNLEMNSEYLWVIDPIDGTNNYLHKFPFFSVSIALYKNKMPLLGVVYNPIHRELFYAEKGKGAFLNDKKIKVSDSKSLKESLLVTGFYYDRDLLVKKTLNQFEIFLRRGVHGVRRTGSAALDLCFVAAGRFDGYWELQLGPWDYAAGALILEEAGGKITSVDGKKYNLFQKNVLASNGKIHGEMLEVIRG